MILSTRISSEILTKCDCHAVPMLVTQVACALIVPVRLIPWLELNQVKNIADIFLFRFCSRKEIVKFPEWIMRPLLIATEWNLIAQGKINVFYLER